ncbi:MAG: hypothetical protein ASARMPREDX12_000488 [Alectoria sarmentosa]|nr:MAG: hypothetical protein ASARMPREDX12_000488 [Alectoria sarmentosa]
MLAQDTLNTEKASIEDSNNDVPIATEYFKRAWNRLSSAPTPRQHDKGEDQIERGEHKAQAKVKTHIGEGNHEEDAEAGATPSGGQPAEAAKRQQHSPFSSSAFDRLPQPVPVVDVFFGSWWFISALRTATRPVEHIMARVLLKSDGRYTGLCKIWWFFYLLITPMAEFRQNYMAAWQQSEELSIHIFVDDENVSVPIPKEGTDEAMLARIRSFYQMMLVGQGFPALVFPKHLQRVDFVEMSTDSLVLGSRLGTLQLGRYKGRLVNIFENPQLGAHTIAVAETIRTVPKNSALEFQRTYDVGAISAVVRIYAHKANADLQVIIATAFTVSSYIVTAGALTLALIAFLDQKRVQNDDMIEKIARRSVETKAVASSKLDRRSSVP